MRLKLFIAASSLAMKAIPCCFDPYTAADTYLYRIMEDISSYDSPCFDIYCRDYFMRSFDFREENLRLWREQTGTKMSDEHLRMLVYGRNADLEKEIFNNCQEASECLEKVKSIQKIREAMADPWYFPSSRYKGGKYTQSLEELAEECRQGANGIFRGRYVLQTLRCYNTLRRWEESIELWEQQRDSLSDDVIRTMAEREVAAAYHKTGNDSIAADIYARIGDIASLRMCRTSRKHEMEYIYEHCPDSPYFPEEIQALLIKFDHAHTIIGTFYGSWYSPDSLQAEQFLKLCRCVLYERKVKNPAMWCYAAAATLDALEHPKESMPYIREGERLCQDDFLRKSFRLLRMHIEAQILPLNNDYEQQLFRDLKWLTHEIDANMNAAEEKRLRELTNYQWDSNTYYWNDAMRRILLSDVCPRLVAKGRTTRALQLANYADYYLFRKLGNKTIRFNDWRCYEYPGSPHEWDEFSYSSELFALVNSFSADRLAEYVQWQTAGKGAFDQFLAKGSNHDAVYWCDIVGTHYLRENRYREAEQWLSRLPVDYEHNTNIYREWDDYLKRNPFDLSTQDPNPRRSRLETTQNYKLNFARKMVRCEHDMMYGKTADIRGEAKVYYAAGLRNQWDYCWALTKYSFSSYDYTEYDEEWNSHETPAYSAAKEKSDSLMQAGLDEITDQELKASLLHAMHRNREIMQNYPFTWTAHYIYLNCDTWRDYAYHSAIHHKTP